MYFIFIITLLVKSTLALIGYDCGSRSMNITTLSLLDISPCDIPENKLNITTPYVQLLQINEFTNTRVLQCKLEVQQTIYFCGMHSHVSIVKHGQAEFINEISKQKCEEVINTGILRIDNHVISGIRINQTSTYPIVYAGFVNNDGRYNGAVYSDPYGTWESVVVQGLMKITIQEQHARVDLNNNKIYLSSGTACALSDTSCIDSEGGYSFWNTIPTNSCKFHKYGILYESYANKIVDPEQQTIYSLATKNITFALQSKNTESVCGYTIIKTEHPKLVIFETVKGESFADRRRMSTENLDIFAYVNSKFIYVEKHIRTQVKQLYRDTLMQRCNIERQTLKNSLAIATQAPDQFAYNLMKGPGYMAVTAGEVVHIVKCIPVEVKIQHGDTCFAELQVTKANHTYFLTPRTHILKRHGTQVDCNQLLPAYYRIDENWYKILPRPTEALNPVTIKPMTKATWKYINPTSLATNGIYTDKDLNELRDRIMFPVEKPALLNDIAREMHGHLLTDEEGTIIKLLNENTIEKIVQNAWGNAWKKFMTFGTASAGIIAILMVIQGIKMVVEVIINGFALHQVYGWSLHLLGAIWSSVTHLLIVLSRPKANKTEQQQQEDISLQETPGTSTEITATVQKAKPGFFTLPV